MAEKNKRNKEKEPKVLSRREFIGTATGVAITSGVVLQGACNGSNQVIQNPLKTETKPVDPDKKPDTPNNVASSASTDKKTKVVLVRDQNVLGPGNVPKEDILAQMLDDAVSKLMSAPADEAWSQLLKPNDTLGIKSNEWRFLGTPAGLEQAIKTRAEKVGISEDRISIKDRGVLDCPVFKQTTALVNVRPLRTHHWSGVGSLIKNYIVFSDDKPSWHADSCADLGGLWDMPAVKGKTRLNILVMLTPLFHGKGPHHYQANYTWPYAGLIVGTDPVAVDATGVRILKAKRKEFFGKDEPLIVSPKHIEVADSKYGLGISNPDSIEVMRLGSMEEALI